MCEEHTARGVVAEHNLGSAPRLDRVFGRSAVPGRSPRAPGAGRQVLPASTDVLPAVVTPQRLETGPPEVVAAVESVRSDAKVPILALLESVRTREPVSPVSGQAKKQALKRYRAQTLADLAGSLCIRNRLPEFADMANRTPPQAVSAVRDELRRVLGQDYSDDLLPAFMRSGADLRL